jgi:glutaredoxin
MAATKKVVFYHSVVCPRCHISNILLRRALRKHADVEVTKIEILKNRDRARNDGVRSFPALVAEGRILTGVVLTPGGIERFLSSLTDEPI